MKICIISNLYPPYARGGAEQVVFKMVTELSRLGHEVRIITLTPGAEETETRGNLTIYRIHPKNLFFYTDAHKYSFVARFFWHVGDMFHFGARRQIRNLLKRENPDVVHTHNLMGIGFLIPRLIQKLGFRHIHTVHDVQLVEPSGIILKQEETHWRYTGLPTRMYTAVMRWLFLRPDVVISPSQFLMDFYEQKGFFKNSKRVMMRNPITLPPGLEHPKKTDSAFSFLYVGQVEKHKGVQVLIDTFLEVLKTQPSVNLHVVGGGSSLDMLKELARHEPKIVFHGKVERDRLPEFFARADMTVVPSLCYENSPTVIFESLSFGVPVLASHIEGIAELIREGENGLTFRAGDVVALREKLLWCMDHPKEVAQMGTQGRAALSIASKEKYMQQILDIYSS